MKAGEGKKGQGKEDGGSGGGGEHGAAVKKPTTKAERRALQVSMCQSNCRILSMLQAMCVDFTSRYQEDIRQWKKKSLLLYRNVSCNSCVIEWIMYKPSWTCIAYFPCDRVA